MNKFYLTLTFMFLLSCAPKVEEEKTSVSFRMPKSDRSKRNANRFEIKTVASTGTFGAAAGVNPSVSILDDIDCYMVAVGFPIDGIAPINSGTCGNADFEINNLNLASYTVSDGGVITINDVPIGADREFYVIGFQHVSNGTNCPDFRNIQPADYQNMSAPRIVGQKIQTILAQESNTVNITISMANSVELNGCRNAPFNWVVGGVFDESKFDGAVFGP